MWGCGRVECEVRTLGVKNALWAVLPFVSFCAKKGGFEQKIVIESLTKKVQNKWISGVQDYYYSFMCDFALQDHARPFSDSISWSEMGSSSGMRVPACPLCRQCTWVTCCPSCSHSSSLELWGWEKSVSFLGVNDFDGVNLRSMGSGIAGLADIWSNYLTSYQTTIQFWCEAWRSLVRSCAP